MLRLVTFVLMLSCVGMVPSLHADIPTATPVDSLVLKEGFKAELLYSVPKQEQGSWVSMCVDPEGRLIVSDQYGKLYRVTPPPIGNSEGIKVEPIDVDLGHAQGLLWAFDSLYVVVNSRRPYKGGLYRVLDTDDDDTLDTVKLLRGFDGAGGEHGPHAVLLSPDKQSLIIVAGNQTKLTKIDHSRVPRVWDEDLLLPRTYGRGFMKGVPAPGGWICKTDPEGKQWELLAVGFRNQYDAAFNLQGDLFTYDADMEWDMNTPWYRPTRVCLASSGAEFGWRNGSGKWPEYFADSVPPVLNIGPGSPTGVTFGYGAKFPEKYQRAFFICDWSYGKLYAVHLKPFQSAYQAKAEEFVTGTPLPLTDIVINPHDGAMYFAIGGRRVDSGLYRITYTGKESTDPITASEPTPELKLRHKLEGFHGKENPEAVAVAWPHLSHPDRFIRNAARIAIEHQPVQTWQDRVFEETQPQAIIEGSIALARLGDKSLQPKMIEKLQSIPWQALGYYQQLALLRAYSLTFSRMGRPEEGIIKAVTQKLEPYFPAEGGELNAELCKMLVYLQAPSTAEKGVALLLKAPTQEEQIQYAKSLRHLKTGWTSALQEQYFQWFVKAGGYRGGASFDLFVQNIKKDAVAHLSAEEKKRLKPILEAKPADDTPEVAEENRPFVKDWTMEDLLPALETKMVGRDFERGEKMFAAAKCFSCHRFANRGGAIGPDLTGVSGRFNRRDLLESMIKPSKAISDQYAAVTIITTSGKVVTGRIANLSGDTLRINTNMLDPGALVGVKRSEIDEMLPSPVSMMPKGLLNTLSKEEILDLMAYMLSGGNPEHKMFSASE